MRTLRDDGIRLCLEGVTTAAEVKRVLGDQDA
jgi:type II secretory ATPase GspE/PulE/Tfp pilus assembly ATPase PilB-like protein